MLKENFGIITDPEDILKYIRIFDRKLLPIFKSITFSHINFNLSNNQKKVHKSRIYYSKKYNLWISSYNTLNDITYAIGKYDSNIKIENNVESPLTPLMIFNFNLNNKSKNYNAYFAIKNEKTHILSKIHNLKEEEINNLSNNNILIKRNDDYYVDWGHIKKVKSFVKNVKRIYRILNLEINIPNKLKEYDKKNKKDNSKNDENIVYKYCMKCGSPLNYTNIEKLPQDFVKKYPAKCEDCLEKIYALSIYDKLTRENNGLINIDILINKFKDENLFNFTSDILNKLGFIKNLNNKKYLKLNEEIKSEYSEYINPPIKFTNLKLFNEKEEIDTQTHLINYSNNNQGTKTKQKNKIKKTSKKIKSKQSKLSKKINGRYSLYEEIEFDKTENKWTAHFNNKFLGYFNSEESAYNYRFRHLRSIPIPPLLSNGKYSLHEGIGFDKLNRLWTVTFNNKFLGKFNSEEEAYEYLKEYKKSNNSTVYELDTKEEVDNINSKNIKKLIIFDSKQKTTNLLLKGNVDKIKINNISTILKEEELNELICNKTENGFEIIIDLNIKSNTKEKIEKLNRLGWENLN